MPKRIIRRELLERRQQLGDDECYRLSRLVQSQLFATDAYRDCRSIALYAQIRNEVQTTDVLRRALADGKQVCFPRVENEELVFVSVAGSESLQAGRFGVAEPVGNELVQTEEINLMLVPGVGFDRNGYRIGYGRGFYDRATRRRRPQQMIGLAYSFQLVEDLPAEDHDVRLDKLITETGIISFASKQ